MVRKIPRKSTATSTIGAAVNWFARRIAFGVRHRETPARTRMASSRPGACRKATAATTPASQTPLSAPRIRSGSIWA